MKRAARKVKVAPTKRYRATLEKTVTFRLTSVIELDASPSPGGINKWNIFYAAQRALAAEMIAGIEREWSTKFVDGNRQFSVDASSIEEIETHIEITTEDQTSR